MFNHFAVIFLIFLATGPSFMNAFKDHNKRPLDRNPANSGSTSFSSSPHAPDREQDGDPDVSSDFKSNKRRKLHNTNTDENNISNSNDDDVLAIVQNTLNAGCSGPLSRMFMKQITQVPLVFSDGEDDDYLDNQHDEQMGSRKLWNEVQLHSYFPREPLEFDNYPFHEAAGPNRDESALHFSESRLNAGGSSLNLGSLDVQDRHEVYLHLDDHVCIDSIQTACKYAFVDRQLTSSDSDVDKYEEDSSYTTDNPKPALTSKRATGSPLVFSASSPSILRKILKLSKRSLSNCQMEVYSDFVWEIDSEYSSDGGLDDISSPTSLLIDELSLSDELPMSSLHLSVGEEHYALEKLLINEKLRMNKNLVKIALDFVDGFTVDHARIIGQYVAFNNPALKKLKLSLFSHSIDTEKAVYLGHGISRNANLLSLTFRDGLFMEGSVDYVFSSLTQPSASIKVLKFILSDFGGRSAVESLRDILIKNKSVQRLKFALFNVDDFTTFGYDLLSRNRVLKDLDISVTTTHDEDTIESDTRVVNSVVASIAKGLLYNRNTLKSLSLTHMGMTDVGVYTLAKALAKHKSLSRLSLDGNEIGHYGVQMLADALKQNEVLESFSVDMNPITENGSSALVNILKNNWSLTNYLFDYYGEAARVMNALKWNFLIKNAGDDGARAALLHRAKFERNLAFRN